MHSIVMRCTTILDQSDGCHSRYTKIAISLISCSIATHCAKAGSRSRLASIEVRPGRQLADPAKCSQREHSWLVPRLAKFASRYAVQEARPFGPVVDKNPATWIIGNPEQDPVCLGAISATSPIANEGHFERAGTVPRPLPVKIGQIDPELPNRWLAPCRCLVSRCHLRSADRSPLAPHQAGLGQAKLLKR